MGGAVEGDPAGAVGEAGEGAGAEGGDAAVPQRRLQRSWMRSSTATRLGRLAKIWRAECAAGHQDAVLLLPRHNHCGLRS